MSALILAALVLVGLLGNGLRLRARVPSALSNSGPAKSGRAQSGQPKSAPPGAAAGGAGRRWAWLTARGLAPDNATQAAACAFAASEDLDLVEVLPVDLPVTAARDLIRRIDPRTYGDDPLAVGRGAGTVLLMDQAVAERAEAAWPAWAKRARLLEPENRLEPEDSILPAAWFELEDWSQSAPVPEDPDSLEPADLIAVIRRVRPYARRHAVALAVAPGLYGHRPDDLGRRAARLRANDVVERVHLALDAAPWALTAAALAAGLTWRGWGWGLAALAGYCLQPYLIFGGTALRPRGLHAAALLRPLYEPWTWVRTAAGWWRSAAEQDRGNAYRVLARREHPHDR